MNMDNIDWLDAWRKVSRATKHASEPEKIARGRKHFRRDAKPRPDPLLDFVMAHMANNRTFLDIGAGTGRWTIPIAEKAQHVTAVEKSDSMLEMLREKIDASGLDNISVIQERWEETEVEPHDIVYCVHGIYETADFAGFVTKMEQHARQRCCLGIRIPPHDGIINILFREIHGHPFDSPNAIIAWNALYSMGIYANVFMEEGRHTWKDTSFEDAFDRAKRHLNLDDTTEYDDLIRKTLEERLKHEGETYTWPDGMQSALLWWDTKNRNL